MSTNAGPVSLAHLGMTVADCMSEAQVRVIWHTFAEA
jgi:hypothetical protein